MLKGTVAALAVTALPASAAAARKPADHVVEILRFTFTPHELRVQTGDTVTWVNRDVVPHTATATDGTWDTGRIGKGERAQVPVTEDFYGRYYCRFHPNMKAMIIVED